MAYKASHTWIKGDEGNKMNKSLLKATAVSGLLAFATGVQAGGDPNEPVYAPEPEEEHALSVQFTLITDYVFRGVSQTEEEPAAQFNINYTHDSGLFLNVWTSNVDYGSAGGDEIVEIDYTIGYATELYGFDWEVGYTYYDVPREDTFDQNEIFLGMGHSSSYGDVMFRWWYNYEDEDHYIEANYVKGLDYDFEVGLHAGYIDTHDGHDNHNDDYMEYKAWLAKYWKILRFELAYHDTDGSGFPKGAQFDGEDDRRLVAGVTIDLW